MSSDDLIQQLADAMRADVSDGLWTGWEQTACAVLASGLVVPRTDYDDKLDLIRKLSDEFVRNDVVPTSAVTDLAEHWEDGNAGLATNSANAYRTAADELRALTRQENP